MWFHDSAVPKVDPLYLPFLVVRPEGADVEFPRTSVSGYAEFFRSVYQGYPAVGRQRSVYGGLWTDRTDAAALLRGKVTIGTIDASLTSELRQIISAGFTVMTAEDYSSDEGNKSPFSGLASKILDRPWLVEVMRAILDDVPVVVEMKEVTSSEASLAQASASGNLPSPAECLALVVPCSGQSVDVDVVPESHLLPEFTPDGVSRWVSAATEEQILTMSKNAFLDRIAVHPGSVGLFGPGPIHRVRLNGGGQTALRLVSCRRVPCR